MHAPMPRAPHPGAAREMLNKVPALTLFFWVIKILCTTVGETAADFLNTNLHLGLTGTTYYREQFVDDTCHAAA